MSIIANVVKVEGNSIFIRSNPSSGILALTSFVDDSSGEDLTHSFTKSFRYSIDGVIFTDWYDLNEINITSIQVTQKDTLIIELQYFKNQPLGDNQLSVSEGTLNTVDDPIESGYCFQNSIFSQFFGTEDLGVLNWYINVLDKLYQRGLIPKYISRLNEFGEPDDFIQFWRGICKFFAYYVTYARQFQDFYQNADLLSEYLEQRGMKTSTENSLSELGYLMQNFYKEVFHRGTIHVVDRIEDGDAVDGEILRLIFYNKAVDEFVFNPSKPEHSGWNLRNSSPLYRGMTIHDNANKFYEQGVEPVNLTKYPLVGNIVIVADPTIGKNVLQVTGGGGIQNVDGSKVIKVDEFMDYELFFFIKKSDGDNLILGFDAFDASGNQIDLQSRTNGTVSNNYFINKNLPRSDKYIAIRVFLYNKLKPLYAGDNLNLRMVDGVTSVVPRILVNEVNATIYNLRLMPMATPYSKGFVQVNNFIDCWLKNNNKQFSIDGVTQYIKRYLIPYDSQIQLTQTALAGDYSNED